MGNNQPNTQISGSPDKNGNLSNVSAALAKPRSVSPVPLALEARKNTTHMSVDSAERVESPILTDNLATRHQELIPVVFRWEHLGHDVSLCGDFSNWEAIPMRKSDQDFTCIKNLPLGKHDFRFIVDGHHKFAQELLQSIAPESLPLATSNTVSHTSTASAVVNTLDTSKFKPYKPDYQFFTFTKEQKIPETDFFRQIPISSESSKEPPLLPPHLRSIALNKEQADVDAQSLATPSNVAIGHMYCTAIKDNLMVLASTQRYKNKYVTTVFYSYPTIAKTEAVSTVEDRSATLTLQSTSVMVLSSPYTST